MDSQFIQPLAGSRKRYLELTGCPSPRAEGSASTAASTWSRCRSGRAQPLDEQNSQAAPAVAALSA